MSTVNYVVEFLGTFVFLYAILQSGKFQNVQPFMIAGALLVAIVMFGSVSGGHFNPAVTAMMYAKKDPAVSNPVDAFGYMAAQVMGGLVAWRAHLLINNEKKL